MQKSFFMLTALAFIGLLTGCAHDNVNAPCPHFGASCTKVPVNSWNNNH